MLTPLASEYAGVLCGHLYEVPTSLIYAAISDPLLFRHRRRALLDGDVSDTFALPPGGALGVEMRSKVTFRIWSPGRHLQPEDATLVSEVSS